jgi:hypothetical protein
MKVQGFEGPVRLSDTFLGFSTLMAWILAELLPQELMALTEIFPLLKLDGNVMVAVSVVALLLMLM